MWRLRCNLQKESLKHALQFGVKTFGFIYNAETRFRDYGLMTAMFQSRVTNYNLLGKIKSRALAEGEIGFGLRFGFG